MRSFSKFGIVMAMLLVSLFVGCSTDPEKPKHKKVDWNENSTIACIGTSLTEGYGAGGDGIIDRDRSYPHFFSEKVRIGVRNFGVSSITAVEMAEVITSGNFDADLLLAAVIIIELGANDLFEQADNFPNIDMGFVAKVEKAFDDILDHIKSLGTNPQIYLAKFYNDDVARYILLPYNAMFIHSQYENMYSRLKSRHKVEIINDIWKGIWGNDNLMSDDKIHIKIHPNAEGYKIMADNIFNSMKGFLEFNGLVK